MARCFAGIRPTSPSELFPELTEREILSLIAPGNNNAEIAERLVLSSETVCNPLSNIFNKLQTADRTETMWHWRILKCS